MYKLLSNNALHHTLAIGSRVSISTHVLALVLCLAPGVIFAYPVCKTDPLSMEWCEATIAEYEKGEADKKLNETYKKFIAHLNGDARQTWINAQRAWVKYFEMHCSATVATHAGSAATRAYTYHTCLKKQIIQRTQELKSWCQTDECN